MHFKQEYFQDNFVCYGQFVSDRHLDESFTTVNCGFIIYVIHTDMQIRQFYAYYCVKLLKKIINYASVWLKCIF